MELQLIFYVYFQNSKSIATPLTLSLFLFLLRRTLTNNVLIQFTFRLGCLKGGIEDIKTHAFFSTTDWDNVLHKHYTPPIIPRVSVIYQNTRNSTYFLFFLFFCVLHLNCIVSNDRFHNLHAQSNENLVNP